MQTWEEMVEEVRLMFNHICIVHDMTLIRVVGIASDFQDVYYLGMDPQDGLRHYTYVGPCESLKGKVERYDNLDQHFTWNRCPPEEEFQISVSTPEEDAAAEAAMEAWIAQQNAEWDAEQKSA